MSGIKGADGLSVTGSRVHYKFGDLSNRPDDNRKLTSADTNPSPQTAKAHGPPARKQLSGSKRDPQEIAEERRLLGTSTGPPDPHGVRIHPRAEPKNFSTFKPVDTLGSGFRSLPSRSSKSYTPRITVLEEAKKDREPQRKKRKVDTRPNATSEVIEIDDEDTKSNNAAAISTSSQVSPASPTQHRLRRASEKRNSSAVNSEYWNVEKVVKPPIRNKKNNVRSRHPREKNELDDEAFTRSAKEERVKSQHQQQDGAAPEGQKEKPPTGQIIAAVEIPTPKKDDMSKADASDLRDPYVRADGQYRDDGLRESPDELQGEKTVEDSWRMRAGTESNLPPSDISPTQFTKSANKGRKNKRSAPHRKDSTVTFAICLFRFDSTLSGQPLELVIDQTTGQFFVRSSENRQLTDQLELQRVNNILFSEDKGSNCLRLGLPQSKRSPSHIIDIRFTSSEDCFSCFRIFKGLSGARTVLKSRDHVDKAIERSVGSAVEKESPNVAKPQELKEDLVENHADHHPSKHKRQKLSDNLQDGENKSPDSQAATHKSNDDLAQKQTHRPSNHAHPSPENHGEVPIKTYKELSLPTRKTRSQAKPRNVTVDSDEGTPDFTPGPKMRPAGWTKPLVYPKTGKKKAEVHAHDLERLRGSEFLNDNLVGFYTRFLEYHLERTSPDLAKRMYFFNSYFFASLTNTPKGVKGINYQAVEKWTRAVDIFSYDYVVVPINESAHWYVMIICNLPSLIKGTLSDDSTEAPEVTMKDNQPKEPQENKGSVHPQSGPTSDGRDRTDGGAAESAGENSKDKVLYRSLHEMTLSDPGPASSSPGGRHNTSPAVLALEASDKEDWPDEDENQPTPSIKRRNPELGNPNEELPTENLQRATEKARKNDDSRSNKKKGRKKPRPPGRKYHPKQPIIITFDSLGCNRSPTVSLLRQYLEEEAQSKKSLTINAKKVEGMSAKQIPLQPNFSDCGLYLLAYLERFIYDPDTFITKLLRKEMDERADWPRLRSGELRRRLRQFLLGLYEEQEPKKKDNTEMGPLIVDTKPLRILIDEVSSLDRDQEDKLSEVKAKSATPDPPQRPMTPEKAVKGTTRNPELIEQPVTPTRSSPRFSRKGHQENQHTGSPVIGNKQAAANKAGGQDLCTQLLEAVSQPAESAPQENEPYVPETPRHGDGRETDRVVLSTSPSTTNSPQPRRKRSRSQGSVP